MSVIRVKHERNYVVIERKFLENRTLSLKAKGLLAYCLSKPDHWEFSVENLANTLKEKKTAIYSALKELINEGYCRKVQGKNKFGKFCAVDYEIYETQQEIQIILPQSGKPQAEVPQAENRTQVNTDLGVIKEKNNIITCVSEEPHEKATKILFSYDQRRFINITEQDKERWKKNYPLVDIDKKLIELENFILDNPSRAPKKNWNAFIARNMYRSNEYFACNQNVSESNQSRENRDFAKKVQAYLKTQNKTNLIKAYHKFVVMKPDGDELYYEMSCVEFKKKLLNFCSLKENAESQHE